MAIHVLQLCINDSMRSLFDPNSQPKQTRLSNSLKYDIHLAIEKTEKMLNDAGDEFIVDVECNKDNPCTDFLDLTEYEYSCNELFWRGKELGYRYKSSVSIIWNTMSQELQKKYPGRIFCVHFCVQRGFSGNIHVNFHLNRIGEFPINHDVKSYRKPTMYAIFKT
ncbi:MAG: hypothetical protein IJY16_04990 [Clostridia bacterium]|nr:hypothetical protein [Clostridia bacterium]